MFGHSSVFHTGWGQPWEKKEDKGAWVPGPGFKAELCHRPAMRPEGAQVVSGPLRPLLMGIRGNSAEEPAPPCGSGVPSG